MSNVSTIRLQIDLLDGDFVDTIASRWLYRASPYAINLSVFEGNAKAPADLPVALKIISTAGEVANIAGTNTDENGQSRIDIGAGVINFDGNYTAVICVNGSKAAEFPLEIKAVGSPIPPEGTAIDWSDITSYDNTATHGPYRAGTGLDSTTNEDGSETHSVKYGSTAGTALEGNAQAADADPAGPSLEAAFAGKANDNNVVKLTGNQTIADEKTFTDALTGPTIKSGANADKTGTVIGDIANNLADGDFAVAEGKETTASGVASHAEGYGTFASGFASHAEGDQSVAEGNASSATGRRAYAAHDGARVEADGQNADVESTAANQRTARFAGGYRWLGGDHFMAGSVFAPPKVVSASITAELDGVYHGVAAATYTDPATPAEGRGYLVRVVNGTQTVGGTAYAAEGTVIFREYHSGAWRNRVLFGGADAAAVRGAIGAAAIAPITAQTISTNTTLSPTISGTVYNLTLQASVTLTLADFPSATQAARITLVCIQDGTGGRVLTFAGNFTTPGDVAPTFSASANAVDTKTFEWTGATWRLVGSTFDQG